MLIQAQFEIKAIKLYELNVSSGSNTFSLSIKKSYQRELSLNLNEPTIIHIEELLLFFCKLVFLYTFTKFSFRFIHWKFIFSFLLLLFR